MPHNRTPQSASLPIPSRRARRAAQCATRATLVAGLCAALLATGCASTTNGKQAQASIAADAASTVVGLSTGAMVELNPLMASGSIPGILVLSAVKAGMISGVEGMPEGKANNIKSTITGIHVGAAANNLALVAGVTGPIGLTMGIVGGGATYLYQKHKHDNHPVRVAFNKHFPGWDGDNLKIERMQEIMDAASQGLPPPRITMTNEELTRVVRGMNGGIFAPMFSKSNNKAAGMSFAAGHDGGA